MASIRRDMLIEAPAADVWAALRDVGAIHQRLARGFVTDVRLEEGARVVTFANGMVARELIIALDDKERRLVWSVVGGPMTHHNASAQVFDEAVPSTGGDVSDHCHIDRRRAPQKFLFTMLDDGTVGHGCIVVFKSAVTAPDDEWRLFKDAVNREQKKYGNTMRVKRP